MSNKLVVAIVIIVVVILGVAGYLWTQQPGTSDTTGNTSTNQTPTSDNNTGQSPAESLPEDTEIMIVYTDNGFAKPGLTVEPGTEIRVQNNSSSTLDFSSDDHPTHTKQSALNVGEIAAGESKTFTIDAVGTWGYHNHLNPAHTGTITAE